MPSNVEIKARVHDFAGLRARAAEVSDTPVRTFTQLDTFFVTPTGRLKLREQSGGAAQLIFYERPDQDGPKRSDYSIFETDEAAALKHVLAQAFGVRGEVEKVRHLFMIGQTRVHLDQVKDLGDFVELEVVLRPDQSTEEGRKIAEQLIETLNISPDDLMQSAYIDLLEAARS